MAAQLNLVPYGKLAIVGSRSLAGSVTAIALIKKIVDEWNPAVLVSGGAIGIDTMVEEFATASHIPMQVFLPEHPSWDGSGPLTGFKARNLKIAKACDMLIRIGNCRGKTRGSARTLEFARYLGKYCENYEVDTMTGFYQLTNKFMGREQIR